MASDGRLDFAMVIERTARDTIKRFRDLMRHKSTATPGNLRAAFHPIADMTRDCLRTARRRTGLTPPPVVAVALTAEEVAPLAEAADAMGMTHDEADLVRLSDGDTLADGIIELARVIVRQSPDVLLVSPGVAAWLDRVCDDHAPVASFCGVTVVVARGMQ